VLLFVSLVLGAVLVGGLAVATAWVAAVEGAWQLAHAGFSLHKPLGADVHGGYKLAEVVTVAGLATGFAGVLVHGDAAPRWPNRVLLASIAWFLVMGIGGLVLWNRFGLELGKLGASGWFIPLLVAVVAAPVYGLWQVQRVARWLWRVARPRVLLAGIIIGASLATSAGVVLSVPTEEGTGSAEQAQVEELALVRLISLDQAEPWLSRQVLVWKWLGAPGDEQRLALGDELAQPRLPSAGQGLLPTFPDNRLEDCIGTLSRPPGGGLMAQAVAYLRSENMGSGDAEDLAWETVLRVCQVHADRGTRDLRSYYFAALRKRRISFYRRPASHWCSLDQHTYALEDTELGLADTEHDLERAFCALPATEREVVTRRMQGLDDAEIARQLGSTEVAVRQAASRAGRKLRQVVTD
jgi:RNA polymerase sigma factor (sigma-70 family)